MKILGHRVEIVFSPDILISLSIFASGGQGLFLKKPSLDPAKTFD
jgi:hypothetical protein